VSKKEKETKAERKKEAKMVKEFVAKEHKAVESILNDIDDRLFEDRKVEHDRSLKNLFQDFDRQKEERERINDKFDLLHQEGLA
jgi:hypothetical protein